MFSPLVLATAIALVATPDAQAAPCKPGLGYGGRIAKAFCQPYTSGYIKVGIRCIREVDGRAPYTTYGPRVWSYTAQGNVVMGSNASCRRGYIVQRPWYVLG